ncbi:MAG TPA: Clp protease N-terminal domain-containing protein, partial [Geobacteraceae bacterium]
MIRPDKMTIKTQEALSAAHDLASRASNAAVEPEHLLLALLDQEGGLVPAILQKLGADPLYLRSFVES